MPEALAATPASANFQKLKDKLSELFELDKADLDFGIYRVLRQRHREIEEFLEKQLENTVREALCSHQTVQTEQVSDELAKAEAAAKGAGITPDQSPRVLELREKLKVAGDVEAVADEVYSHLYTFFSRYYQEGDFLGLHRSTVQGRERYMIPYNGEEVKLVWANMDQYYIKSSELLRDYTFLIKKSDWLAAQAELPLGDLPDEVRVHFKLIEGDTEKDNRKASSKTTRAFALAEPAVEERDGALWIRFAYREHPAERNLQEKLNADTLRTLADTLTGTWKTLLLAADPTHQPKDKKDVRSVLQKHLRAYTARHQFDYFIHKDLGGFLRRELDFYLKNEVMHLDDIEGMGAPKAEEYLSKLRAIRRCASPVIRMLAQLEDFQKKLWLKKKFVVETRYCLTLDRVPEELYPEICQNDAQWQEWEELYNISELKPKRTPEFLKANPYLMVDTGWFGREFGLCLLSKVENLGESLSGVCLNGENAQALELMQERYRQQVKCVYIDPPYNTGGGDFLFKDQMQSSSWISMITDRILTSRALLTEDASFWASIDDREVDNLKFAISASLGADSFVSDIALVNNFKGRQDRDHIATAHEHLLLFAKGEFDSNGFPLNDEQVADYDQEDESGQRYQLRDLRKRGGNDSRQARPNLYFPVFWNEETRSAALERKNESDVEIFPKRSDGTDGCWRWGKATVLENLDSIEARQVRETGRWNANYRVYLERDGEERTSKPKSVWLGARYSSDRGIKELRRLHPQVTFTGPKSPLLIEDIVRHSTCELDVVLDFFAGSGTTAHSIISLTRSSKDLREYILVEMGEHFDTVLVPRLKKAVYSTDWKEGKPQSRDTGISHAFKILRLESYEDALNNLVLRRTPEQEAALKQQSEREQAEYILGYFLDVESAGSASLLNLAEFRDPFAYKLKIATSSAGETKETLVDLVETFNWLLGLKVRHIDTLPGGFVTVTGERRDGKKVLIIWRKLGADAVADNAALQRLFDKLQINPAETSDTDYAAIYVNGPHTLADPHGKIHLTEEEFHRRMFANEEFAGLE